MMADGVVGTELRDRFWTGVAGETFTVDVAVYGAADTDFSGGISFDEIGAAGDYALVFTPAAAGSYFARWTGDESGQAFQGTYQVVTAAQADPAAALASATITLISPVAMSGDVEIYRGYDYRADDDRALRWSTSAAGTWPDLTGAEIYFSAEDDLSGHKLLNVPGSVIQPTGTNKQMQIELTKDHSAPLKPARYRFLAWAKLAASDHLIPLVGGTMTVKPNVA